MAHRRGRRSDDGGGGRRREFDAAEIRAAFAELDGLRRALGTKHFTALSSLLPFSRNDYWEVAELRQRLGRP